MSTDLPSDVDRYLKDLVACLQDLPPDERTDIRDELAASFREQIAKGKVDVLEDFPPAIEYAAQFADARGEDQLAGAKEGPLRFGRAALVLALLGPLALAFVAVGTASIIVGIGKIFVGDRAGLFVDEHGTIISFGAFDAAPGRELFGWLGVPVFCIGGLALAVIAYLMIQRGFRWARR